MMDSIKIYQANRRSISCSEPKLGIKLTVASEVTSYVRDRKRLQDVLSSEPSGPNIGESKFNS